VSLFRNGKSCERPDITDRSREYCGCVKGNNGEALYAVVSLSGAFNSINSQ
jgi:hypothetical protein